MAAATIVSGAAQSETLTISNSSQAGQASGQFETPNTILVNADGKLFLDRPHSFRLDAFYTFPIGLTATAFRARPSTARMRGECWGCRPAIRGTRTGLQILRADIVLPDGRLLAVLHEDHRGPLRLAAGSRMESTLASTRLHRA